jgi:hypothetical protein
MLYRRVIPVCCENHMEQMHTIGRKNAEFLFITQVSDTFDIAHRLKPKLLESFGDWTCLRHQVERGEVEPTLVFPFQRASSEI